MPAATTSHPDRLAATLANLSEAHAARPASAGPWRPPGPGAADCRIDLKLLSWRARLAAADAAAARRHLAAFPEREHPDLWAGTVRDGVARGFAVRLEEAIALAPARAPLRRVCAEAPADEVLTRAELRRKKDLLVASGGPRARFSRRGGVLLVDRARDLHSENCLWFEARRDLGTLDGFAAAPDERPRLFSAQFLRPERYVTGPDGSELQLVGRLGRGPIGWPCRVTLTGLADADALRLEIDLATVVPGWRLRVRFLGIAAELLHHECEPVREVVDNDHGGFVTDTLVRSCSTLLVDGAAVDVPGAADPGPLSHAFSIGKAAASLPPSAPAPAIDDDDAAR